MLQLLFLTPEGQNFTDNFAEHLQKFKEDCKNIPPESLVRLTEDPSCKCEASIFKRTIINHPFIVYRKKPEVETTPTVPDAAAIVVRIVVFHIFKYPLIN